MNKPSTIDRMKNVARIRAEIEEIASGKRGFISHTGRKEKETGILRSSVRKWANEAGLSEENHGKYGLCFSRRTA